MAGGTGAALPRGETLFISDDDVAALSDWRDAVDALRHAYAQPIEDRMLPPRTMARGTGVWLRSLTAVSPSGRHMGSKLIGASTANGVCSYLISLFSLQTMQLAALIDGNHVTGLRTAATSALAMDLLAPQKPLKVAVLGSGFEARSQLEALIATRRVAEVTVYSPSPDSRRKFIAHFAGLHDTQPVRDAAAPEAAVKGADVVICAARSHGEKPILLGSWLEPGMTVVSIGSTLPEQREVASDVVARAESIIADMVDEVAHDTGDMQAATADGVAFAGKLVPLGDLVSGRWKGRSSPDAIVLFKSVGSALQDIVAAEMLLARARAEGRGTPMPVTIQPQPKTFK